ncbi:MAG: enoyl-CoA hydratase-related protein [Planctomycetota bacterium]
MTIFSGQHFTAQRDHDGTVIVRWDFLSSPINLATEDFVAEFEILIGKLETQKNMPLIMLASGKKGTFGRGWSGSDLFKLGETNRLANITQAWDSLVNRWASLPCPTVAAVSGICLDEAMDLVLASDYRVSYQSSTAQMGWTSLSRGWPPPIGSLGRLLASSGVNGYTRFLILEQLIQPLQARRWKLIDLVANDELQLRKSVDLMRKRAFINGKKVHSGFLYIDDKPNWIQKIWANWMLRGLRRFIDKNSCIENPLIQYFLTFVEKTSENRFRMGCDRRLETDLTINPTSSAWVRKARSETIAARGNFPDQDVKRVFLLGESDLEFDIAWRAIQENTLIVVVGKSSEELGRRVMRLAAFRKKSSAKSLNLIKGILVNELSQYVPQSEDAVVGGLGIHVSEASKWDLAAKFVIAEDGVNPLEHAIPLRKLHGHSRVDLLELGKDHQTLKEWLCRLGFHMSDSVSAQSVWRICGALWAESLRALAEGLSPHEVENEARRFGFAISPLADLMKNHSNLTWLVHSLGRDDEKILNLWAQFVASRRTVTKIGWWMARQWKKFCGIQSRSILKALPASALMYSLPGRWSAVIQINSHAEKLSEAKRLESLESRVGWPVFRGTPKNALKIMSNDLESYELTLSKTFGARFAGLAKICHDDNA